MVVRKLPLLTQRTSLRQFFSPTRKYFLTLTVFYCIPVTGTHPKGIEGANQTIFVSYIALGPPASYFGKSSFKPSEYSAPTTFERLRATVASIKSDLWAVEEPGDTQSLSAATSGVGSTDIEEGNDKE
jgi:hypothetical protein